MTTPRPRPPAPKQIEIYLIKIEPIGRGYRFTYFLRRDDPTSKGVGTIPKDGEKLRPLLGGLPYGDRVKILVNDVGTISGLWIGTMKVYPFRERRRTRPRPTSHDS